MLKQFSCLMPVYNTKPEHLLEAVFSLTKQTVVPTEIVIVDDGSTDNHTLQALQLLQSITPARVIRLEQNMGTSVALNAGHAACCFDWIAIMGSDDVAFPARFQKQLEFIQQFPDSDIVGTGLFAFWDSDPWRVPVFSKVHPQTITSLGKSWLVNHGTVMYRKDLALANPYNPLFRRGQDVELWARLFAKGYIFRNCSDILYAYRRFKP